MSFEDVTNGGPATWYVGTAEAIRSNRGDMGARIKPITRAEFMYYVADCTEIVFENAIAYYQSLDISGEFDDRERDTAFGFICAMQMFCPERLEK